MIYSLNGTVILKGQNFAVIECGGVGYKCLVTMNTLRCLPGNGEQAMLYTHMIVREDAVELCGFSTTDEMNCFKLLTSISGVGAKVAVAILSELKPEQLALAVSVGDSKMLTRASGVGNKLAQRIILELKDKVKKLGVAAESSSIGEVTAAIPSASANISQALGALAVLGYTPEEVLPFMNGTDPDMTVEQIIAKTLKAIGKK